MQITGDHNISTKLRNSITDLHLRVADKVYEHVTEEVWYDTRSNVWHTVLVSVRDSIRDVLDR
jgi:hypothetical protein